MMTKLTKLAQVYFAIQPLHAEKPKAGWRVLESADLSSATEDFKRGWAFGMIALHGQCQKMH